MYKEGDEESELVEDLKEIASEWVFINSLI